MAITYSETILNMAQENGFVKARELRDLGIPNTIMGRMVDQGALEKVTRGIYRLPEAPISEHHSLAVASLRIPQGMVCLISALSFHNLTTQIPFEVWLALENKAWEPQVPDLPLRFVWFSGEAYTEGVEKHLIENTKVQIYSPAKTVADCFKYRNKIGLDVAVEGLREGLDKRKFTPAELFHYAKIDRVHNVIRPYVEALT